MGFVLSFIKIKDYPQHRQVCLTMPRKPINEKRPCLACGANLNHRRPNVIFCDSKCRSAEWKRSNPVKYKAWFIKNKADADLAKDYADEV